MSSLKPTDEVDEQSLKMLACAVILRAIDDYRGIGVRGMCSKTSIPRIRAEAETFLRDSESLKIWCSMAEKSASAVMRSVLLNA